MRFIGTFESPLFILGQLCSFFNDYGPFQYLFNLNCDGKFLGIFFIDLNMILVKKNSSGFKIGFVISGIYSIIIGSQKSSPIFALLVLEVVWWNPVLS